MDLKLQQETAKAEAKQWQEDCIREVILSLFSQFYLVLSSISSSYAFPQSTQKLFFILSFQGLDPNTSFLGATKELY